jgi:hypothetical protein
MEKDINPIKFKQIISDIIKPHDNYVIFLSSGIDSRSIFFESIEQKKNFKVCSFTMEGILSTDFLIAKQLCELYSIEFIPVYLSNDIEVLKGDLDAMYKLGCRKKTDYVCFWPFFKSYPLFKEETFFSGLFADGHFCLSKKGMIHFKSFPEIDNFRKTYFIDKPSTQIKIHGNYCSNVKKQHVMPYLDKKIIDFFMGTKWEELNKPQQKNVIKEAYKNYNKDVKVFNHINLQLGDSGISTHFDKLLNDKQLNPNNKFKSIVGIFNRISDNPNKLF